MSVVPIRLVVTDVDGTLVRSDRSLAPSTIAAAAALRTAGIRLALVSARAPAGLDVLIGPLALDTPRAGFNGGVILSPQDEVLQELTLPAEAADTATRMLEALGLDIWVFAQNQWFGKNPHAFYIESERRSILMRWTGTDDFRPLRGGVHKIMGSSRDFACVAEAAAMLRERLGDAASVQCSQLYYVDVTHPQADKGRALGVIAGRLGIAPDAVAAIGDMPNDVAMFHAAALSFAMGNAPEAVQAQADHVVSGHDADGWSEAAAAILARAPSC